MKKSVVLTSVLAGALAMTGCSSKYSTMQTVSPGLSNQAAKYEVLNRVTGSAECQTILFFEVGESDCSHGLLSAISGAAEGPVPVQQKAMSRAVDSMPNADAMLAPRFTFETDSIPLLMTKKRVTVSGKAIEFK